MFYGFGYVICCAFEIYIHKQDKKNKTDKSLNVNKHENHNLCPKYWHCRTGHVCKAEKGVSYMCNLFDGGLGSNHSSF